MIVKIEGERYEFDPDKIRLSELRVLKASFGLAMRPWLDALGAVDPDAVTFLVWLLRTRKGESLDMSAIDLEIGVFEIEEGPPDPTSEATSGSDAAATSEPSPIS